MAIKGLMLVLGLGIGLGLGLVFGEGMVADGKEGVGLVGAVLVRRRMPRGVNEKSGTSVSRSVSVNGFGVEDPRAGVDVDVDA